MPRAKPAAEPTKKPKIRITRYPGQVSMTEFLVMAEALRNEIELKRGKFSASAIDEEMAEEWETG